MKHSEKRIIKWSANNPNSVERAFRKGFLIGARCGYLMKENEAVDLLYDLCDIPVDDQYDVFDNDDWDNTSSAFGRGFGAAISQVTDWISSGSSRKRLEEWMPIVRDWAREVPLSKERSTALPPLIRNWSWNEVVRRRNKPQVIRKEQEE